VALGPSTEDSVKLDFNEVRASTDDDEAASCADKEREIARARARERKRERVLVCGGRYGVGEGFFSSSWDRVWAE
jgi:hypothetical protein